MNFPARIFFGNKTSAMNNPYDTLTATPFDSDHNTSTPFFGQSTTPFFGYDDPDHRAREIARMEEHARISKLRRSGAHFRVLVPRSQSAPPSDVSNLR